MKGMMLQQGNTTRQSWHYLCWSFGLLPRLAATNDVKSWRSCRAEIILIAHKAWKTKWTTSMPLARVTEQSGSFAWELFFNIISKYLLVINTRYVFTAKQVVSVLAFYSDDPSLNPGKAWSFLQNFCLKRTNNPKEAGWAYLINPCDSGCDSVGRVVVSDVRSTLFESSHLQFPF